MCVVEVSVAVSRCASSNDGGRVLFLGAPKEALKWNALVGLLLVLAGVAVVFKA